MRPNKLFYGSGYHVENHDSQKYTRKWSGILAVSQDSMLNQGGEAIKNRSVVGRVEQSETRHRLGGELGDLNCRVTP